MANPPKAKSKNAATSPISTSTSTLPPTYAEQGQTVSEAGTSSNNNNIVAVMSANPVATTVESEQEKHNKVVGELAAQLLKHFLDMPQNNNDNDGPSTSNKALQPYKPFEPYSDTSLRCNPCNTCACTKGIMPAPILATVNSERTWVYRAEDVAGFCANQLHQTSDKICAVKPQIVEKGRRVVCNKMKDLKYEVEEKDEAITIKIRTLRRSERLIHKSDPIIVEIENKKAIGALKGDAEEEAVVVPSKRRRTSAAVSNSQERKNTKKSKPSKRRRNKNNLSVDHTNNEAVASTLVESRDAKPKREIKTALKIASQNKQNAKKAINFSKKYFQSKNVNGQDDDEQSELTTTRHNIEKTDWTDTDDDDEISVTADKKKRQTSNRKSENNDSESNAEEELKNQKADTKPNEAKQRLKKTTAKELEVQKKVAIENDVEVTKKRKREQTILKTTKKQKNKYFK